MPQIQPCIRPVLEVPGLSPRCQLIQVGWAGVAGGRWRHGRGEARAPGQRGRVAGVSVACRAYHAVLYTQNVSIHIFLCFICKVFLLSSALYVTYPYHAVLCMQSVRIVQYCVCEVSLLLSALYMQIVLNI